MGCCPLYLAIYISQVYSDGRWVHDHYHDLGPVQPCCPCGSSANRGPSTIPSGPAWSLQATTALSSLSFLNRSSQIWGHPCFGGLSLTHPVSGFRPSSRVSPVS